MQKHSILDVWRRSWWACVLIAPGNVLCRHNKHLMWYFQFLLHSFFSLLPSFEYLRKTVLTTSPWEYPHPLENIIYYSDKRGPPKFFHLDTSPVLEYILVHSVNKTHALLLTVELVWLLLLNTVSFNFVPMPNKSLRFTRFRTSYVNCTAVIQSHTAFLLDVQSS